jgi:asparaginyl-tRNA synthetase
MRRGTARRTPIRALLAGAEANQEVEATGWVKTSRFSKNVSFLHLYDGSTPQTVQVVLASDTDPELKSQLGTGAALRVRGRFVASPGGRQDWEIAADSIEVVGPCDPSTYPLQKKRTTLEHLRTIAHLRPRTNTHQAVIRVRNAVAWQIHCFFQQRGFLWIHTPIISASDAEGAGEVFHLSTGDNHDATGFFGTPTFLTVSGQLQAECFAQSHTDVYTFGPTFRAENSNTARHAAEFWMVEPEMAFATLDDVIALEEDFVKVVAAAVLEQCSDDFAFFDKRICKGLIESITKVLNTPFARVTYTEAQAILEASGRKFSYPIGWGSVMKAEHERYLAEEHFGGPVFVTDYPMEQKPFYMRANDDGRTVAATDLLVPRIGELIGGSAREERHDKLVAQFKRTGLDPAHLGWYLDLRRWGSTPHGGFGLGFDRMLMWLTGMQNIRDVIPLPRTPGNASF